MLFACSQRDSPDNLVKSCISMMVFALALSKQAQAWGRRGCVNCYLSSFASRGCAVRLVDYFSGWRNKIIAAGLSRRTLLFWCAAKQQVRQKWFKPVVKEKEHRQRTTFLLILVWVELLLPGKQLCSARDGRNSWTPSLLGLFQGYGSLACLWSLQCAHVSCCC